jgi:RHS repeat-associated protein
MGGRFIAQLAEKTGVQVGEAAEKGAEAMSDKLLAKVADTEEQNLESSLAKNSEIADSFHGINPDNAAGQDAGQVGGQAAENGGNPVSGGGGGKGGGGGEPDLNGEPKVSGGQPEEGVGGTPQAADPVDIVSGQMLMTAIDLELPGVLPLILRRAYASGYQGGRLFGPGWSSTLDQRIQIDADGIHFAGDDAQILHYPIPAAPGQQVLPAGGARWPLAWDRTTDSIRIEDPNRGWTWQFDAATNASTAERELRHLTRLADRNDNAITIHRDQDGLPTEVDHSGGYRVAVDCGYNSHGFRIDALRMLAADDEQGIDLVRYEYDPLGRLVEVIDFSGTPYVYEYDRADRITAWIDRAGYRYQYDYDASGRVVRGIGEDGYLSATFEYDTKRRVTLVSNSLGHATGYHYDEHGHLTRVIDPNGGVTASEFDRYGRLLSRTDELGRTTRFVLDSQGDPMQSVGPDGAATEIRYTDLRLVSSIASAGTTRSAYTYDERGNLLAETDAAGGVTRYEYDEHGAMVATADALGNRTVIGCDRAGLIASVTDPLGRTTRVMRDRFGRVVEVIDALGGSTRLVRRPDGQVTERALPDGSREVWEYDAAGSVIEHCDQAGMRTRFEPGPFNRMKARIQPDGARFEFAYDTEFHLTTVTGDGVSWAYEYDPVGRLIRETDFNGRSQQYVCDAVGQLLELTDADGRSTAFDYNDSGDLISRRSAGGVVTTFDYDEAGFLRGVANGQCTVEYTHDVVGRVLAETVDGRTLNYEYDLLGRCTRRVTPTGIVSEWTYDATDHPLTLAGTAGSLAFEYDDLGRETTRYLGSGLALTQSWDACHRLTGQAVWASDAGNYRNISQRNYGYAANGLVDEIADSIRGRRSIVANSAGRVTEVTGENWSERYAYDKLGNITRAEHTDADADQLVEDRVYAGTLLRSAAGRSYEYDQRNRLTRMRTRTLSGKLREWLYTWNDDDQLIQVATPDRGTWAYRYDPLGRRIGKQRLDGADPRGRVSEYVEFTWDETRITEQVATRTDGSRHAITWDWEPGTWRAATQTESSWAAGEEQAEIDRRFFAIVTDLVDAADQLVAADGSIIRSADIDIWGRRTSGDGRHGSCPLGRPGQYRDEETGLDYNYFRYYDSQTGRYLTTDPLGLEPAPNPHTYVINPLAWIDPLGLKPGSQANNSGGHYGLMQPANPGTTPVGTYEINHMPAKDSWLQLGLTDTLSESAGPAIRMEFDDHRKFISTGSGKASERWRATQAGLISQGKFDEAMKMDIDEIRRVHGTKYDAAIKEMVADMPKNRGFQKFLKKNGWSVRYCLLK